MRVFNVKCGEGSELGFIGQVGTWGKKKGGRSFILNRVLKKKERKIISEFIIPLKENKISPGCERRFPQQTSLALLHHSQKLLAFSSTPSAPTAALPAPSVFPLPDPGACTSCFFVSSGCCFLTVRTSPGCWHYKPKCTHVLQSP